jgi:AmiR/NasT family two-component response regulator
MIAPGAGRPGRPTSRVGCVRAAEPEATLETRTAIDVAVGIIMVQNRCSQDEAFELLKAASGACNVKLHVVAAAVV